LGPNGQTVIRRTVREALDVGPSDRIGYMIQGGRVVLTSVKRPPAQEDPLSAFEEWASEADTEGCASL
jgi:hypothetical protein